MCWKRFVSPHFEQTVMKRFMKVYQSMGLFFVTAFINSILHCSNRLATALMLPDCCIKEALEHAVDEGPALKVLRGSWQREEAPETHRDASRFRFCSQYLCWGKLGYHARIAEVSK